MATIEEIERYDALIRRSEANALRSLASHLREAVIDLPAESQLARAFVKRASTFEHAAMKQDISLHGDGELWMLTRDVGNVTQQLDDHLVGLLRARADAEDLRPHLAEGLNLLADRLEDRLGA